MTTPLRQFSRQRVISICFALIAALLVASCSSKSIVASWTDPAADIRAGDTLVVGVAQRETMRKLFENSFVEDLRKENIEAVASYTVTGTGEAPDYDAIINAVSKVESTTVLVTRLAGVKEKTNTQMAVGREYMIFEQAEMAPIFMNPNPTYATNTRVKLHLEARLYDVGTRKMIWSATAKVTEPVMTKKYIDKVTDLFMADLKKNNML